MPPKHAPDPLLSSVGLLGAAIGAVSNLRTALRIIADKPSGDSFFLWLMARNLLVALGFGSLLGLAAALSVFSGIGIETIASWIGAESSGAVNTATRIVSVIVIFVIDTAAVELVFRLLSGMKTSAKALWVGAAYGGFGLIVLQEFSSLFVRGATTNPLLASFAALIALLLWFNLSAQVILIASSYIVVATEDEQNIFPVRTLAQYRLSRAQDRLEVATLEFQNAQKVVREEIIDAR